MLQERLTPKALEGKLTMTAQYNPAKFRELVLYIAAKSQDDPHFGNQKLAKILYFSDFVAYGEFGASITGAVYQKFPHGPFPKVLYDVERELRQEEAARTEQTARYIYPQDRLVPLREANVALFTDPEIALVNNIMHELRPYNGKQAEDLSHDEPGWKAAADYAEIPYAAAFLSPDLPTAEDIAWVQSLPLQVGFEVAR